MSDASSPGESWMQTRTITKDTRWWRPRNRNIQTGTTLGTSSLTTWLDLTHFMCFKLQHLSLFDWCADQMCDIGSHESIRVSMWTQGDTQAVARHQERRLQDIQRESCRIGRVPLDGAAACTWWAGGFCKKMWPGVQFNRHLKFKSWVKAWVKDEVKEAFRKAPDREMVKAWVEAWVKAVQNVYWIAPLEFN